MAENVEPSAKHWLFQLHESCDHTLFTKMVVTLWAIWYARWKSIHEGVFQSPMKTPSFVQFYISGLVQIAKPVRSIRPATSRIATQQWLAPPEGVVKINVDGAVARNIHGGAVAAVCRDHSGMYLGASAVVYRGIVDHFLLETFACREALALADDLLVTNLKVPSDCLRIVNDINKVTEGPHSAVIHEIKIHRDIFPLCYFVHELWSINFEAHNLAKSACNMSLGRHVWLGMHNDPVLVPLNILDQ
ncbi:hypothetical protein ZWY2020_030995 [Hordeum vulgare]|nr:hypothetical protein ZWY2020_030995 [Hordeum vulgare]